MPSMSPIKSFLLTFAFTGAVLSAQTVKRPNILWLIGENISHDLGCYGAQNVRTPNLDRLAAEGVRFTQCLRDQSRVRAEPFRVFHRHVSDHDGHAAHAVASRG